MKKKKRNRLTRTIAEYVKQENKKEEENKKEVAGNKKSETDSTD